MSNILHDERQIRIEKLAALRAKGIDPYPARVSRTSTIGEALNSFDLWSAEGKSVTLAGRIRLLRRHGGLTFARLEDESGDIQVMLSKTSLGEAAYELLKEADMADFIAATGKLIISKTGEKTVEAATWTMLTKAILPLPEKWHGLKNEEERYRRRYVDLIVNPDVKNFFRLRSRFIASMRAFLLNEGFMEVETPVLEHVPGGAEAEPFITHHNTMDIDLYLRISLELHLKRLIVGGYEKIFEIGKVFRNEGMSPQHLQEFTEMEFYWAYADNELLMGMVQRLYQTIIKDTFGTLDLPYKDQVLHFGGEWPRLNYVELLREHAGIDLDTIKTVADMRQAIADKKIPLKIDPKAGLGRLIDQVYKKTVRPKLVQPCFLVNHPVAVSPLAKRDVNNPNRVERHQVLIATAEVGNAFSELNDPLDQRQRFEDQMALRAAGDNEAQMIDEDYLRALEHGMPPTAGFGVGIDRLLAILTNQESIRDTVLFPTMRPEEK